MLSLPSPTVPLIEIPSTVAHGKTAEITVSAAMASNSHPTIGSETRRCGGGGYVMAVI